MIEEGAIRAKYISLFPVLDERARRLWAASEAKSLGYCGISIVARATGLTRNTIRAGLLELEGGTDSLGSTQGNRPRIRRGGAGRRAVSERYPGLLEKLESLVEPVTRGDPESPLRWTCKSVRHLSIELQSQGYPVCPQTVSALLHELDYSLQANRKTKEGSQHPDRNAQFEFINSRTQWFQRRQQPVISVDTKKKELVGDFKNGGREWRPKGQPEPVRVHDFIDKDLGKAIPYGVYDVTKNLGWVSVGIDHDTPEFAVETIRRWWLKMGAGTYPHAKRLLITADAGGSNSYRARLWKSKLQEFADNTGLHVEVCHFPPSTSKWNKIEHRLFCHITENWRGRPLVSHEVIVQLIGATTTSAGLQVAAALDEQEYEKGKRVTDEVMRSLKIKPGRFCGDWNYSISPRKRPS